MSTITTKAAGAKITGLLALTCVGESALAVGDFVHLTGDYTVDKADGTKPVLGHVSVRNVKRTASATTDSFPVGNAGGDVTVEARGLYVRTIKAGGTITAGASVGIGAAGKLVVSGTSVSDIGIALTGGATNALVDVLVR